MGEPSISLHGKTPLDFQRPRTVAVKVYKTQIFEGVIHPWAQDNFGEDHWIFQQDGAPATLQFLFKSG